MDVSQIITAIFGVYGELLVLAAKALHRVVTGKPPIEKPSYEERIGELINRLSESSKEVELVLQEMQTAVTDRGAVISQLEKQFTELNERKESLETLIRDLEQKKLSHDVVKDFLGSVETTFEKSGRRSSRQNLIYFVAGLLLSIPIGIGVNLLTR